MSEFDPYLKWLGIRDPQRPPNYYRLLGIEIFEDDPDVISSSADRQMSHVRTFQTGPNGERSQALLSELAEARRCLLNVETKAAYDRGLRSQAHPGASSAIPYSSSDMLPPGAVPSETVHSNTSDGPAFAEIEDNLAPSNAFPELGDSTPSTARDMRRRQRQKKSGLLPQIAGIVGGGILAVVVSYFVINSGFLDRFRERQAGNDQLVTTPKPAPADDDEKNRRVDKDPSSGRSAGPSNRGSGASRNPGSTKPNQQARASRNGSNRGNTSRNTPPSPPNGTAGPNSQAMPSGPAPWENRRLPSVPSNWTQPRNELDRALMPVRFAIGNRDFDRALTELASARSVIARYPDDTNWDQLIPELRSFWEQVAGHAQLLPLGSELVFRSKPVKLVRRSDDSIRLRYGNKIRIFKTTIDQLDRDLAVAIAMKQDLFPSEKILEWTSWDYNHLQLRVPNNIVMAENSDNGSSNADGTAVVTDAGATTRLPIPSDEEVEEARLEVQNRFPRAYQRINTARERLRIANRMINLATNVIEPAEQYVTLIDALNLARLNGSASVVGDVLRKLNERFDVSEYWNVVQEELNLVNRNLQDPQQAKDLFEEYLTFSQSAFEGREYDVAIDLADKALRMAKKAKDVSSFEQATTAKEHYRDVDRIVTRGLRALKELASDSNDHQAHLQAGEYLFLVLNDFEKGALHLSKSNDDRLKQLGTMELNSEVTQQKDAPKQLGDAWFEWGGQAKDFKGKAAMKRARHWYALARPQAEGLGRSLIDKRLATIDALLKDF